MQAIQYEANGEASDWMLGKHGIIAMSPELGIKNGFSDDFFITQPDILKTVLQANADWVLTAALKIRSQLFISTSEATYYSLKKTNEGNEVDVLQMELSLSIYNKGLEKIRYRDIHLDIDPNFIDSIKSVSLVGNSRLDHEQLTLRPIANFTSRFNFTISDIEGRKTKKLVFILRSKRTDIFNSQFSDSVLKLAYKELLVDEHHRELEIFSDVFKSAEYSFNERASQRYRILMVSAAVVGGVLIAWCVCWLAKRICLRSIS